MRYVKDKKKVFFYKTSILEEAVFKKLNLSRSKKTISVSDADLLDVYKDTLPITNEKKKDLLSLLPYIST